MKEIEGGICAVPGVSAYGIKEGKYGLSVILAEGPATGVFTRNKVVAAPVVLTRERLEAGHRLSGLIVNSGNANAFTGKEGFEDAKAMSRLLAEKLSIEPEAIGVASTGVIGHRLDLARIKAQLPKVIAGLEASPKGSLAAAKAIMTTDTFPKEVAVELESGIKIGGLAKGSGMIEPNMGTMLSFIYTDADLPAALLNTSLKAATDESFNMVVVDGDTSTNDMVLLTATGKSGIKPKMEALEEFQEGLNHVLCSLAKKVAADGEGATKLIEVRVRGAKTEKDAKLAAKAVVRSPLVKTAVFGKDPNWGRVMAAVGYSGAELDPEKVSLSFMGGIEEESEVKLVESGKVSDSAGSIESLKKVMESKEIIITVELGLGKAAARAWGCDFSYDYVRINAEYTT